MVYYILYRVVEFTLLGTRVKFNIQIIKQYDYIKILFFHMNIVIGEPIVDFFGLERSSENE